MGIKIILLIIFFVSDGGSGNLFEKTCYKCRRFCSGRKIGRTVADGICIWNIVFFGSCICRICRTVWMEIRNCQYMDRHRKCINRKPSGMGSSRKAYKSDDTASWIKDDAGFFGERYKSKSLKITASVIVFVFLIPYTASVYNGLSRLFAMAFNIPYTWCVVTMAAFTALYVILGGYMATAINDFIQGIIMLIGIVAVIAAVLNGQGGFMNAIAEMAKIPSDRSLTQGQPGVVYILFWSGSAQSSGRCSSYFAWNMGTSADDREILCDQR
mgnify:CR=1 FL=1